MGIQRVAAGACAVAGVALLAGLGWALLAAAVMLFVAPAPHRLVVVAGRVRAAAVEAWRWLAGSRRAVAVAAMPAAIGLAALGAGLAVGLGAGLVVAGAALGGVSLLTGWNT